MKLSPIDFADQTSDFQTPITFFKWSKTQSLGIHFLNWIVKNILVIKFLGLTEILIFLTPAPVVSVLEDRYIMQHYHT